MNKHEFQMMAKKFRAGRVTLEDFANNVCAGDGPQGGGRLDVPCATGQTSAPMDESTVLKSGSNRPTRSVSSVLDSKAAGVMRKLLPNRASNAHKGDFGRVLVIGGSDGMPGAISLTGLAALRTGSGLVTVATPEMQQDIVARFTPCYMTVGCEESKGRFSRNAIDELFEHAEWADVVAIGPGMGRSKSLQKIMTRLYAELPQPLVVDADGLNNLAKAGADLATHEGLRMLTPHPGEMQRLLASELTDRKEMEKQAIKLASDAQVTIVLKGHQTLVTDGKQKYQNKTGNPGMATAGSGDVLTGMLASLIGQGLSMYDAAGAAVYFHGLAGDLAAESKGQMSLISTDILDYLPAAFIG